jgi:hypothetical protein
MYLFDVCSGMSFGQDAIATGVAAQVKASLPWDMITNPPYAWGQLADAAVERDNMLEAIAMIEFAYWAADAEGAALAGTL